MDYSVYGQDLTLTLSTTGHVHCCPRWVNLSILTAGYVTVCRPQKGAPSRGGSGPHIIHTYLGPHQTVPKWHLDQFSRFCRAYGCKQQTDTQSMLHHDIDSNRLQLATATMQPKHSVDNSCVCDFLSSIYWSWTSITSCMCVVFSPGIGSMNDYKQYTRAHRIFKNAQIVNNGKESVPLKQQVVRQKVSRRLFTSVILF